ncbi:MAG: hypothetical protein JSW27_22275 [Phycisphaerales bacterium]|nr:MAG: hypothetical protein JSW27_22275 [Phycisphaerales bacterium]
MATVDLTESEASTLRDVIQNYLSELHSEISHTDDRDFKAALRKRQELLQSVFHKLGGAVG